MHNNLLGEGYWCVHNPCVIFSRVIDVWILGSELLLGKQKTLALWKFKIDHTGADVDREACRVEVPGPVKYTIIQYLGRNRITGTLCIPPEMCGHLNVYTPPKYDDW